MHKDLKPKDHAEAVALFRAQVLGPVLCGDLGRRELAKALHELSEKRYMPPASKVTRTYGASTLERWYYAYRKHGLDGLRPQERKLGNALVLTDEQRELIVEIRRDHPSASVPLILSTLENEGRVETGKVKASAVRRLLASQGLDRRTLARLGSRERRRWQADRPGRLWHADVCHGPNLSVDGRKVPVRIHALLDDASRFVPMLLVRTTEREVEMLDLLMQAVRKYGKPDGLYLDNGPTYVGEALATACGRLGIALRHAKPYDAPARGKMERFWRTLREGCLDFVGTLTTVHEVQVRLLAFLDTHYHHGAHAGLLGKTPAKVWALAQTQRMDDAALTDALTVRQPRRVRADGTVSVGGIDWEVEDGWLASTTVVIARTLADPQLAPWVEHEDERLLLRVVDPERNAHCRRKSHRPKRSIDAIDFDPNRVRINKMLGRNTNTKGGAR